MRFESMGGCEVDLDTISAPGFDALYNSLLERSNYEPVHTMAVIRQELARLDDHIRGFAVELPSE